MQSILASRKSAQSNAFQWDNSVTEELTPPATPPSADSYPHDLEDSPGSPAFISESASPALSYADFGTASRTPFGSFLAQVSTRLERVMVKSDGQIKEGALIRPRADSSVSDSPPSPAGLQLPKVDSSDRMASLMVRFLGASARRSGLISRLP